MPALLCTTSLGNLRSSRGAGRQACHVGGLADRVIRDPTRTLQSPSAGKTAGVASKTACSTRLVTVVACCGAGCQPAITKSPNRQISKLSIPSIPKSLNLL